MNQPLKDKYNCIYGIPGENKVLQAHRGDDYQREEVVVCQLDIPEKREPHMRTLMSPDQPGGLLSDAFSLLIIDARGPSAL